jgi:hypothetical protein
MVGRPRIAKIGGNDAFEILVLPFDERPAMLNAGIVDENIEAAMFCRDGFHRRSGRLSIAYIKGGRLGAATLRRFSKRPGIAAIDQNRGAMTGKRPCHGKTQPPRGAGYQGNTVVQREKPTHDPMMSQEWASGKFRYPEGAIPPCDDYLVTAIGVYMPASKWPL